jgi:DNA invertase Pin-like site-specific DNA recombinase
VYGGSRQKGERSLIKNQKAKRAHPLLHRLYAARRGWEIVEEFTDQGVSGCRESRPALNRLMADACRRRFDAVLVWKIDRFGRSLKHLVNALAELAALGVAFISLRDNIDLSTPSGSQILPQISRCPPRS